MKKLNFFLIIICCYFAAIQPLNAKKVKFAVDMTDQTVASTGIHVAGDFQSVAGFAGGDWTSGSTLMTREGETNIYSIVVDVPAPAKYEYAFLNGDQWYNVEFIPSESRIGYEEDTYRWIYVDNAESDTIYTGAIKFSSNAPADKYLVRLLVDMENQTVDAAGVHVAGDFQNWQASDIRLYNFVDKVYEGIVYMPSGANEYKFYNGNTTLAAESVPVSCAVDGNRIQTASEDEVKDVVCFASCSSCSTAGIQSVNAGTNAVLYPTNAESFATLKFSHDLLDYSVCISDISGHTVQQYDHLNGSSLIIKRGQLTPGVYFVATKNPDKTLISVNKLMFK